MTWFTVVPPAIMPTLSIVLGRVPLPLHPSWPARLPATTCAMTAVAALGTGVFVSINYGATPAPAGAAHVPEWALSGDDRQVPDIGGVPVALLTAGLGTIGRTAIGWLAERRIARVQAREPLETDVPIAVAVPRRTATIRAPGEPNGESRLNRGHAFRAIPAI